MALSVAQGLYSVQLGDAALPNMGAVPTTVFSNPDVRLRVWFNDGVNGSQLLTPDQRITSVADFIGSRYGKSHLLAALVNDPSRRQFALWCRQSVGYLRSHSRGLDRVRGAVLGNRPGFAIQTAGGKGFGRR